MISSHVMYNGVNVVLAVACLISLFLVSKFVPDKRTRTLLIVALILMFLSAPALIMGLRIFKITPAAVLGDGLGMTDGASDMTKNFRYVGLLGSLCELIAIVLFAAAAKRLFSPRAEEPAEEPSEVPTDEPAGEEE
jgi:hypothetical protein